jgi:hypothetical protein
MPGPSSTTFSAISARWRFAPGSGVGPLRRLAMWTLVILFAIVAIPLGVAILLLLMTLVIALWLVGTVVRLFAGAAGTVWGLGDPSGRRNVRVIRRDDARGSGPPA